MPNRLRTSMAVVVLVIALVSLVSVTTAQNRTNPLVGVWRIAETVAANGTKNTSPQPSLYIFTATHYSILSVNSTTPRPAVDPAAAATTDAQRVGIWDPFTANSGTYEVQGAELTTRPIVAKNPIVMASGAFNKFEMKIDGSAVWLQQKSNAAGPVANAAQVRLVRVN